jgi:uncharacterized RDD family membrane protein YckC
MENDVLDSNLINSSEVGNEADKWAGFWIRVGASFIDFLVYLPLIGLNFYNVYRLKSLSFQLIIDLILILYKPVMEYKYGATVGKMAVKIKVVNYEFGQISISQAIIRYIPLGLGQLFSIAGTIILFQNPDFLAATTMLDIGTLQKETLAPVLNYITSFISIISCLVVAFSLKKQGLHDMLAKTYCVNK